MTTLDSLVANAARPVSAWAALKIALQGNNRPLSLRELQDDYDVPKSEAQRLLCKMQSIGWVTRLSVDTFTWATHPRGQ